jgi:hypothetical protein
MEMMKWKLDTDKIKGAMKEVRMNQDDVANKSGLRCRPST